MKDESSAQRLNLSDRDSALLARWSEPAPEGARFGINRYVYEILQRNPTLRQRFENLDRDGDAYVEWLHAYGREELSLIDELMPPAPSEYRHFDPRIRPAGQVLPRGVGVNVAGFLQAEMGIGEAGRLIVAALDERRIPVLPIEGMARPDCRHGHHFDTLPPQAAGFPITITCANPDWLTMLVREAGPEFFTERYSIGYWWWEVDGPTPFDWRRNLKLVNEVWTASEHIAGALRHAVDVPVITVRQAVEVPAPPPLNRAQLGMPDGFMFLFMFDYASTLARKNPMAVIEAFKRAFGPGEGATLVIKCINHRRDAAGHEQLLARAGEHPDVHVVDDYVSWEEKNAMVAACDCYVSLHRAEGFGLPLAEAMYLGKPTIATGYSGNLEFMNAENSHLVRYTMTEVGEAGKQYPPNGVWADPDVEHAAELMRRVFEDQPGSRALGERAAADIRRTNSMEAAGASMELRLANLVQVLGLGPRGSSSRRPELDSAAQRLALGPIPPPASSAGPLGRPLRRLLLRVLRPFTAYQRELDERIVAELAGLRDGELRDLEMKLAAARAAELAVGRMPRGPGEESLAQRVGVLEQQLIKGGPLLDLERFEAGPAGWVLGYRDAEEPSAPQDQTYLDLERAFRGPEALIRARQRRYLPLLERRGPVLDLGCGRGELLELLQAHAVEASGVDIDAAMVELCLRKHLDVRQGDAMDYLEGLHDQSLGVVFASQLIEHLRYDALLRLLRAAALKLRPDGRLVLESVNPHSPLALKHFWIDRTHHHPLFPEVVLALCRMSGFASGYIWFPGGSGDAENDRAEQLDYSVVAERAPREPHPPSDDAVSVSTDVGELWYPADCQVLTPALRQAGTWDPEDGAAAPGAASAASRPFSSHRARFEAKPRFVLTYTGSGRFHTRYHSTPPNPGGLADTNDADDSSTQRWSIKFDRVWAIPRCGTTGRRPTDPCTGVRDFLGAHGASTVTGRVSHRHVDGLFPSQDASISCRMSFSTPKRWSLRASVSVRYLAKRQAFAITALNPVFTAVNDLPGQCPGQGDPIDGLFDNYFTPGFSFSSHYGPDRWFTSGPSVIPLLALRRSSLITLALHQTRSGTPPRNCAVPFPAYQRCRASGSWAGMLRLRRVG